MRHIALCPQCKEPVPKAQLQEHIAEEHSKVPCALCGQEFEKHVMEDHKVRVQTDILTLLVGVAYCNNHCKVKLSNSWPSTIPLVAKV